MGAKPFTKINEGLEEVGLTPVKWLPAFSNGIILEVAHIDL